MENSLGDVVKFEGGCDEVGILSPPGKKLALVEGVFKKDQEFRKYRSFTNWLLL